MRLSYLDLISSKDFEDFIRDKVLEVFPGFSTINPVYKEKLLKMQRSLARYISDETLSRPLLYLILGPPGAGKSYLVKCLTKSLDRLALKGLKFQAANLSEMTQPSELYKLFQNIINNARRGLFTVTFLDEFDVKLEGGSAIKHLINPIYDGQFWNGKKVQKFGRCAFFFAGSYLQDRETLVRAQKLMSGIDLNKFLLSIYLEMRNKGELQAMQQIKELQDFCYTQQKWRMAADPRTDVIFYLRSLEKIRDFLSRVGGNTFEIIDLACPLSLTQEQFTIEGQLVSPSARVKLAEIIAYVMYCEAEENTFLSYDPLLEYKNVMLCERLARVIQAISGRFGDMLRKENRSYFEVDRRLLNFLTVVPLINGMRSLEQLICHIEVPANGQVKCCEFDRDDMGMVIQDNPQFYSPVQVWDELRNANARLGSLMHSEISQTADYIRIPFS